MSCKMSCHLKGFRKENRPRGADFGVRDMYLLGFVSWVSLYGNRINRDFFIFFAIDFSMMLWKRESTVNLQKRFPAIYGNYTGRLDSHGLDVNFLFRHSKGRHTLHDSTLKVQRLWINKKVVTTVPKLHLYIYIHMYDKDSKIASFMAIPG